MNEKDLSKYFWLKKEINDLENRLLEFGDGISATSITNEIKGSPEHISIQEKRAILVEKLFNARLSALEEYIKIESYIEKVDDVEIRQIMRYRFLDLLSWNEIGAEMLYDRTTISKKLRAYLKHSHNSHQ